MSDNLVEYRYSDTDFIAYLITLGYKYTKIEVCRDRNKQLKAFVYFKGYKEILLQLYNQFKTSTIVINLSHYSNNKKAISRVIKSEILKYQANNLIKYEE